MGKLSRRQFLKAACLAGTSALVGACSDTTRKLIPYVIPPEDIVPGEATWYATTCRECPAGCGILAKNRDGRVIKVEGNPLHPVNTGKLCARGQASVQGIYNPDRYRGPMMRSSDGKLSPVSWEASEKMLCDRLVTLGSKVRGEKVVLLTDLRSGAERDLIGRWLAASGSAQHVMYEPFAYEALRKANQTVFGTDAIPTYRIDKADFLLSFGANFLETWVSNVQFARQFASFHEPKEGKKNAFVYVGPRLSMTAADADQWIMVPLGGESVVALGLLRLVLLGHGSRVTGQEDTNLSSAITDEQRAALKARVAPFTPDAVERATGVKPDLLAGLAAQLARAERPLILAEGMGYQDPKAYETALAANLLLNLFPGSLQTIDFSSRSSLSDVVRSDRMEALAEAMLSGEVDVLLIDRANPVFNLPVSWQFEKALRTVPVVVSFSSLPDETGEFAHLVLPTHTFLESWGDYSPRRGVHGLLQPVMGPLFATRELGDILLSTGRRMKPRAFPEKDMYEVLRSAWSKKAKETGGAASPETFWQESLKKGGLWPALQGDRPARPRAITGGLTFSRPEASAADKSQSVAKGLGFIACPTIQFFDGRTANRPFLQEMPDPVTQITWAGWVEINPETARKLNIEKGDLLTIRSEHGMVKGAAFPYLGIAPGTLAMPVGHGHSAFGRFAQSETTNPLHVTPGRIDSAGGIIWPAAGVAVEKEGRIVPIAHQDGSPYQHDRNIVQSITLQQYRSAIGGAPEVVLPLPQGWDKRVDYYLSHRHIDYRWVMIVDLDRCIGCGACTIACYAENNVGVVGRENVLKGRHMAWLHIQRYIEAEQPCVRFLPMLCQHCDEAPCESVCPVFAPNHNAEGINNQVYNRCIGTRFCSQNCPYKVRRFNWFTWKHDRPLEWQLNPDVTVREKGVMEKCSFCIQRINAARIRARSEDRLIRDGEVSPACVQTCPADALIFGSLLDAKSRVSKLIKQARAYQVLGDLNTKPGVIYLKRITQVIT
jgi:anaerobic selenocysteine-containing dehydrogenase/Fe-S-cluster-containing dehydrogenase component